MQPAEAVADPVTVPAPPLSAAAPDPAGPEVAPPRGPRIRAQLRFATPIVLLVLGIKALLLLFSVAVALTAADHTITSVHDAFGLWKQWDASNYLSVATHGYQTTGDAANYIVFLPGYPLAIWLANVVVPAGALTAAFVVTGIASVAAAVLLAYLVLHDSGGDKAQATRAAWFLLIFPTAYFLHVPYTESLFLSFVLGSFYAARTGHWAAAGIVGALAALTRLNGILLVPALAVEAYVQYRQTGRREWRWLWIAFIATGLLVYLGINQHSFGDPFHFQDVQAKQWFKHFQNPYTTIHGMLAAVGAFKPADALMFVGMELGFLLIGLIAGIVALFKLRASYGVWAILNVALFASTSFLQSTPRYVITVFPIFLLLARIKPDTWRSTLVTAASLLTMAWLAALYAMGRWAF